MSNKTVYIYALRESGSDEVRYVGKTELPAERLRSHIVSGNVHSTHPKERWIGRAVKSGRTIEMEIIEECDELDWEERETYWIAHHIAQGESLTNKHPGGKFTEYGTTVKAQSGAERITVYLKPWAIEALEEVLMIDATIDSDCGDKYARALISALNYWRWLHPKSDRIIAFEHGIDELSTTIRDLPCNLSLDCSKIVRDAFGL